MQSLSEHATVYEPAANVPVKGVIQIVHGMAEHQKRYAGLAHYLNDHGYVVITSDLRGHGDNVQSDRELGYFGDNAVSNLVDDVQNINLYIKTNYPGKPCILLGHSMGTLIASTYLKKYDNYIDALFLSGMPGDNGAKGIAKLLIKGMSLLKGDYYRSKFINGMCNGPFSKAFPNEGSDFAWLATDKEVWKKYEADPKCGYTFTLNGFYTLMELMTTTYSTGSWIMKNKDLPIRLISGSDDPCMGNKKNFQNSVNLFRNVGYTHVTHKLYQGQRHEIFNDTEHEKIFADLVKELDNITAN